MSGALDLRPEDHVYGDPDAPVTVLEYGAPSALEYVAAHGDELAAVLVEPVHARSPDLQPREFLQDLRRVTEATGTALVFDEMVTGFRTQPGGAQETPATDQARVAVRIELRHRHVCLHQPLEIRLVHACLHVHLHRAELEDHEAAAAIADPFLPIKDRAGRG